MANGLFSQNEIDYLKSQRLARIATAAATLSEDRGFVQPDVVPVGFDFGGDYFYVGVMNLLKSTKYQNVLRNNMVAIVIDGNRRTQRRDNRSGVLI